MSASNSGPSFRIARPPAPSSSAPSSAAPTPSPSTSNPSSPRSDTSSNPAPPSLSRASSSAFKIPHAPVRPSPLAAAQRGSGRGFIPHGGGGGDSDSDDEDGQGKRMHHQQEDDEIGWDLDSKGRGTYSRKTSPPPLTIAPLANKDWRESSRSSKTHVSSNPNPSSSKPKQMYLPSGARVSSDISSAEPIITREVSSTDTAGGLILASSRTTTTTTASSTAEGGDVTTIEKTTEVEGKPLTLEERAMKALLASANGEEPEEDERELEAIPTAGNQRQMMISEEEAFRRDVETRPDESSMSDYKRIPVASFGLALLKGMGWKEGSAASRTRTGLVEPYNPAPRPAMLGIGAKERIVPEGEELKGKKKWKAKEEARKYIPVVRKDGGSAISTPSGSAPPSRRNSRSRSPPPLNGSSRGSGRSGRERSSSKRDRERSTSRERERDSYRSERDGGRRKDRSRSRERERSSRRDGDERDGRSGRVGRDVRDSRRREDERKGQGRDRERDRAERDGYDRRR